MAAVHGSNTTVLFDQFDMTGYLTQATVSKSTQAVDVTPFQTSGFNRSYIAGPGEGTLSLQGLWDDTSTSGSDVVFYNALGTDTVVTLGIGGYAAVGTPALLMQTLSTSYGPRMPINDAVRITTNSVANGGIRVNGKFLQPLEAETTTFNNASVDNTASSASGGVAHLHVTAFSGTNATFKVQHSANDSAWSDLVTFSSVTAVTSERVVVTGTVERYLRFICSTDNYTSATLACSFARYRRS